MAGQDYVDKGMLTYVDANLPFRTVADWTVISPRNC